MPAKTAACELPPEEFEEEVRAKYRFRDWLNETSWRPNHTKILVLAHEGKDLAEISMTLHLSTYTIQEIQAQSYFKSKLNSMELGYLQKVTRRHIEVAKSGYVDIEQARAVFMAAAVGAARQVVWLSTRGEPTDSIKLRACQDILDRAGLKPVEVVETRERVYSPEEVIHARKVLEETQAIITRLSNQSSPYILNIAGDPSKLEGKALETSVTDKGHAPRTKESRPTEPVTAHASS